MPNPKEAILEIHGEKETCSIPRMIPKKEIVVKKASKENSPKLSCVAEPERRDSCMVKKQETPRLIIKRNKEYKVCFEVQVIWLI